jgi:two-component system, sensor histidine kinase and response regulator
MATISSENDVERRDRQRRHEATLVPALRTVGFVSLSLLVASHGRGKLGAETTWDELAIFVQVVAVYAASSWLVLLLLLERFRGLPHLFLTLDLALWGYAIYWTGGDASWLYPILLLRVADQAGSSFGRMIYYTGLVVVTYGAVLACVALVDGHLIAMGAELTKLGLLLVSGLYLALTTRATAGLRARLATAVRTSRMLVSQLQGQAADLEASQRDAEQSARAKSEFLARMSHEIRTPLNGVSAMVDLVLDTPLTADQRECLVTSRQSADLLLEVVNDVLDYSKLEAKKLHLESVSFELSDLVARATRPLAARAYGKGLELLIDIAENVPRRFVGDPTRLVQVIINLLTNAIKFTDRGSVTLEAVVADQDEHNVVLAVNIRDTGIGIPADQIDAVFQAFTQADTSTTRRYGGTGLGLAICRDLVVMMGGQISATSAPGEGTTFRFQVRLGVDPTAVEKRPLVGIPADLKVLVLGPAGAHRDLLARMVRSWRMTSIECTLAEVSQQGSSGGHQLAVLSIDGTDASAAVQQLRRDLGRPTLPAVVLAPAGQAGDVVELPMTARLSKPVIASHLLEAITALLLENGVAPTQRQALPAALRSLHVLVADDNPVNRLVATRILERAGHRVEAVEDGRQALAALARSAFDVALLDVQMPELDGLATAQIFRVQEPEHSHMPIVALTAQAMPGDRELCLAVGMDGYLAKPFKPVQLLETIAQVMARTIDVIPEVAAPAAAPTGEVDQELLRAQVGGDESILRAVAAEFLKDTPVALTTLTELVGQGDAPGIARAAHRLKGSLLAFAAERAATLALETEEAASSGDVEQVRRRLPRLLDAVTRAQGEVAALFGAQAA